MRVLLTGGTGFVGRQVLARLLEKKCEVRLVVRELGAIVPGVEQIVIKDLFTMRAEALEELCLGIDVIIHAAWYAVPSEYLRSNENITCLTGSLLFAKAAIVSGVKRFVGIGTCYEYDLSGGYLRSDTPLIPATLYGACKASLFLTLAKLMENETLSFAWCRLFYLHGEGEDERRLVPYIRACLAAGEPAQLTSGKQIRDYLDVRDAGFQIADLALDDKTGPVNICSGKPITVADLAFQIADEYGRRDLLHFGARDDPVNVPPCVVGELGTRAILNDE